MHLFRFRATQLAIALCLARSIAGAQEPCTEGWSRVGTAGLEWPNNGYPFVTSMTVFDDGTGPALFVGGIFDRVAGQPTNNVAKWDGRTWHALPGGPRMSQVSALAVFDDGSGPAIYAAGEGILHILLKWTGAEWVSIGSRSAASEYGAWALTTWDDGTGVALYVGGNFRLVDGIEVNHLARWNGIAWSAVGNGLRRQTIPNTTFVGSLAVFDDGSGEALYVGGTFDRPCCTSQTQPAMRNVGRWDGVAWSALGAGLFPSQSSAIPNVQEFEFFDGALFATGIFDNPGPSVARWTGSEWAAVGSGLTGPAPFYGLALETFDDGDGDVLFASGLFDTAGGDPAAQLARWDGEDWTGIAGPVINDIHNYVPSIPALQRYTDLDGPALFIGGAFTSVAGIPAPGIARWGCMRGDLNCDGRLNFFDIDPFLLALFDPAAFAIQFPNCNRLLADLNRDNLVAFADIDGFVAVLFPPP